MATSTFHQESMSQISFGKLTKHVVIPHKQHHCKDYYLMAYASFQNKDILGGWSCTSELSNGCTDTASLATTYRKPLPVHWNHLPGPAPEPSEVHPEYCLLVWSLAGQPQLESAQQVEVLLLLADLQSKHANDTSVTHPLCSLADKYKYQIIKQPV